MDEYTHEHTRVRTLLAAIGMLLLMLAAKLPLCRLGLHDDCECCSPASCVRCGGIQKAEGLGPISARYTYAEYHGTDEGVML